MTNYPQFEAATVAKLEDRQLEDLFDELYEMASQGEDFAMTPAEEEAAVRAIGVEFDRRGLCNIRLDIWLEQFGESRL